MGTTPHEVLTALEKRWISRWHIDRSHGKFVYLASCATSDITQPYHAISYLTAALRAAGHKYAVRDFGIEFWHYVMSPTVVRELGRECERRLESRTTSEHRDHLLLYCELLQDASRFQRSFAQLQNNSSFYEPTIYVRAVQELSLLPRLLTLFAHDSEYRTFSSASPPGYRADHIDLISLRDGINEGLGCEVLDYFYEFISARIAWLNPVYCGLTVPFLSQLEHSLLLGRLLKRANVKVTIGGPTIAKFVKYSDDLRDLWPLSSCVDFLAPGEGETLITELFDAITSGKEVPHLANLVCIDNLGPPPQIRFENVNALPSPEYGIWDYSQYASPTPGALYSPTRGCYWNKCAFCDYGLAVDGPTSPWRTRSPQRVVEDLTKASQFVSRFFFAVDVLSPSYATKISRELVHSGLNIKWMADFRLESSFDETSVSLFQQAGCLGAAFGMESADQETLDAIDKGTSVSRLQAVVGAFADSGIPVQLMGFTGFPGETRSQAETTLSTAAILLDKAATAAIGKYGLSKGSLVAKNPAAYDVEVLYDQPNVPAIPWDLKWRLRRDIEAYPEDDFSESFKLLRGFPYPFLGATSTLHSLLYFEQQPKAPFSIPSWSYEPLLPGPICVIPCFFRSERAKLGDTLIESGLTGRVLVVSQFIAQLLNSLFPSNACLKVSPGQVQSEDMKRVLQFLMDHSLAMFLPERVLS